MTEPNAFAETDAGLALRAIQKYDQQVDDVAHRHLLIEAETRLGRVLALDCTGADEENGFFEHDGDTCPIHEWLVPSDADGIE